MQTPSQRADHVTEARAVGVVVIGSLNMDLIAFAPRLPRAGETLLGTRWTTAHGGKGSNQAVAAARMGARVAMIGRVGEDAYGQALRAALIAESIDCDGVAVDHEQATGVALITVDAASQNTIVVIPGSNGALLPAHVDAQQGLIAQAHIVVCQLETPLATVAHAIAVAAGLGKFVILNPAPASERGWLTDRVLRQVSLLIPNDVEAAQLTGLPCHSVEEALQAAQALRARGAREVIVTLGERGVVHLNATGGRHYAAYPTEAVDTTAAGDTFIGALAASLALGEGLEHAIAVGQLAASIAVSRIGAQSSIPGAAK